MSKPKKSIFKNPGIIMTIIQLLIAAILFIWFPTSLGWLGIPLINWVMITVFFIWTAQAIIYLFWIEKVENKKGNDEKNNYDKNIG